MYCISFKDKGYVCFDEGNYYLFHTNQNHQLLIDYVSADLSDLRELLNSYIDKSINTETFELRYVDSRYEDIQSMKDILISAHPYYNYTWDEIVAENIVDSFNKVLITGIKTGKIEFIDDPYKFQTWYNKLIDHILSSFPKSMKSYTDCKIKFNSLLGSDIFDAPFNKEINTQKEAQVMFNLYTEPNNKMFLKDFKEYRNPNTYDIKSLRDLLYIEILTMVENKIYLTKCENPDCYEYFISTNKNKRYCDGPGQYGKSCRIEGSINKRKNRLSR